MVTDEDFEAFVLAVGPRLRRALLGIVGVNRVDDAVSEAFAYAYEHWDRLAEMSNPAGYLFRVAQSPSRSRKAPRLFREQTVSIPDVEPRLVELLLALPKTQRTAVWLAHGCGWSHSEIADAMGIAPSTVATHLSRGLDHLRNELVSWVRNYSR